jgi:tetraacyldisaccharide 4'-kinase
MKQPFSARRLLFPLIPLYRLALALRDLRLRSGLEPVRRLRSPVVSIGNLSTGGTGKTPLTVTLAKALAARGLRVDVLSRGYGRQSLLAYRVNPEGAAGHFGDEPLLIAREARVPVYVAPQRYDAGLLAEADAQQAASVNQSPIIHLLDDGFQHRQLARSVNILLLNRHDWKDWLLPAGNLREPRRAARRASVIAIPMNEPELEAELRDWGWSGPLWRLRRSIKIPHVNGPVAAFCGIARPQQFFAGLEAEGLHLAARTAFPDHHCYSAQDLDRLVAAARASHATALVTTEKDLTRLGTLVSLVPDSMPLKTVHLRTEIEDQAAAIDWLIDQLGQASTHPIL